MANDTAFRAGRFLQGQVTQDFSGCGPVNPRTYPNGDCTFFGCQPSVQGPCITRTEMPGCGAQVGARFGGPGTFTRQGSCITADCTVAGEPRVTFEGPHCPTQPRPFCPPPPITVPPQCPPPPTPNTQCATTGPECQTHQPPNCPTHNVCCEPTRAPEHCPTHPQVCTVPPGCPEPSVAFPCTQFPPQCPGETNPIFDCTFGCTQFGPSCPTSPQQCVIQVTRDQACNPPVFDAVGAAGQAAFIRPTMAWPCSGPTPATRCFVCPPPTFDFSCNIPQNAVGAAAAPGTWPTPQTRCFVCDPQAVAAPGGGAHITLLTVPVWACGPTPATRCFVCPAPGGGGGGQTAATVCTQFSQQCQSAVDACPTRLCGGGGGGTAGAAAAPGTWPTPQTRCFVCDPMAAGGAAAAAPGMWPTPATRCFVC